VGLVGGGHCWRCWTGGCGWGVGEGGRDWYSGGGSSITVEQNASTGEQRVGGSSDRRGEGNYC